MLILLMIIAVCVMIITYIFQYLSHRKSLMADEICKFINLEAQLDEAFKNEYNSSDKPYSREMYLNEVMGLNKTYHQKLSNTLHEHHNRGELSQKIKQLRRTPDMEIEAVLPNFMTEVRRVAHILSLEIDGKLRKKLTDDNQSAGNKRRRRR